MLVSGYGVARNLIMDVCHETKARSSGCLWGQCPLVLSRQVACLVPCDEGLDVIPVDEHFPTYLDKGQSPTPDLAAPKPLRSAELKDQFLDGVESFFTS